MLTAKCDGKGRLYLRESLRSRHGEHFAIVETGNGLVLLSIPKDPIADLYEMGKAFRDVPLLDVKKRLRKRAVKEVLS